MTAVADVLNGAADLIERDGWCQKRYYAATGERCVDGAIFTVQAPWMVRADARRELQTVVGRSIIDWNDAKGRTKAEVVAALRAAAERAS